MAWNGYGLIAILRFKPRLSQPGFMPVRAHITFYGWLDGGTPRQEAFVFRGRSSWGLVLIRSARMSSPLRPAIPVSLAPVKQRVVKISRYLHSLQSSTGLIVNSFSVCSTLFLLFRPLKMCSASGGSSTVLSTSTLTATSIARIVGDGSSDSDPHLLDGAWSNTIAEDHLGLGSTGTLTLDSESNATVSTSMSSKLSSTATANDGLAVATSQWLISTGIEYLTAEVGGQGLLTAINQCVFKPDATSTTDDASALGINKATAGILDSTFIFGIADSTISAKDFNTA